MKDAKGAATLMETEFHKLRYEKEMLPNNEKYRQAVVYYTYQKFKT